MTKKRLRTMVTLTTPSKNKEDQTLEERITETPHTPRGLKKWMRNLIGGTIIAGGLLLTSLFLPTRANAQTTNNPLSTDYPVSGQVTDNTTGAPIEGASITILEEATGDTLWTGLTNQQGEYNTTITDIIQQAINNIQPNKLLVGNPSPNPVRNGQVTISYATTTPITKIQTTLYDALGRKIPPNKYLSPGVYFLQLSTNKGEETITKKLLLLQGTRIEVRLQKEDYKTLQEND